MSYLALKNKLLPQQNRRMATLFHWNNVTDFMTTSITTQSFMSYYPITRSGQTVDVCLQWFAECHYREWKEKHDEGSSEPMSELEHIELVLRSVSVPMRDDEIAQAKKSALHEAWSEIE